MTFYQLDKGSSYDTNGNILRSWLLTYKTNLTNITLEDLGEATITNLTDLCYGFKNLKNVDMSNFNAVNATECYRMFQDCNLLQNVTTLNLPNCNNYRAAFSNCVNLTTFPIKPADFISNSTYRYMYNGCNKITEDIHDMNVTNCNLTVVFNNVNSSNMYNICIVNSDIQQCFQSMRRLSNINNFTVDNCKNATISSCANLRNITDFTISNGPSAASACRFQSCSNLRDVTNLNVVNSKNLSSMFSGCSNLTNISNLQIDNNTTNMASMLFGCPNLSANAYANIANGLPNTTKLMNKYLSNIGLNVNKFTDEQINILNAKGYIDAVPFTPIENASNYYVVTWSQDQDEF